MTASVDELHQTVTAQEATGLEAAQEKLAGKSETPVPAADPQVVVKDKHMIQVPAISQLPELPAGCEVTSLAMLTKYLGLPYTKMDLVEMMPRDRTPPQYDAAGNVTVWGDPEVGFVGNTNGNPGFGMYHQPLAVLLSSVYKAGAEDLTGHDFEAVKKAVSQDKPVIVWTTIDFVPTNKWVTWQTPQGKLIKTSYMEHAVLLVGYDRENVYLNNPYNGQQAQKVNLQTFLKTWEQFGKQAVTYRKA
jgi:uncharacterized protein YvpB